MLVTVFTDASWCPHQKVGGWGAWVKCSNGSESASGVFKHKNILSAQQSELMAIANGLTLAILRFPEATKIGVHSDCLNGLEAIEGKRKILPRDQKAVIKCIKEASAGRIVYFKHVKGHVKNGDRRNWVNNLVDDLARKRMLEARSALRFCN